MAWAGSAASAHDSGISFRAALLANVNAGGENCHRGSALGALLGAAVGLRRIPTELTVSCSCTISLAARELLDQQCNDLLAVEIYLSA